MARRTVAMLVGKPPRRGTVVAEVAELLSREGVRCEVLLPHEEAGTATAARRHDLVVHRGLSGSRLDLVAELDAGGLELCNPWSGAVNMVDRAATYGAVDAAGVPTPRARIVPAWTDVLELAAGAEVVVKVVHGAGRSQGVLAAPLPDTAPCDGPFLVQRRIPHDGVDRKLYVAGDRVHGLLKPSTLTQPHTTEGEPFEVDDALADLALRTAEGVNLHLLGVDVVIGPDGPVVVDVNVFPGYRDVEGAAESVATHLLGHLA